jgi:hypothetical protein
MSQEQTAKEALHATLRANKELGPQGSFARNGVVARNVPHEDLGYFSDLPSDYGGDPSLICRLAAHARQDASHALINTKTIMDDQRRIKRRLWVVIALLVVVLLAVTQQHS